MHRLLVIGATSVAALALSGSAAAWSWPADGDVLRPFALAGDPYAAGQHRGIDVAGPAGSSIRAPASGTVSFAGSLPTHGRSLTILTADGYAVTLVHLGTVEVAKGDAVEEGSAVATMGSSGEPEHPVPSVHLGVRVASQEEGYVDPLGLLPPRSTAPHPEPPAAPSPIPATPPVPSAGPASSSGGAAVPSPAPAPAAASAPVSSGAAGPSASPVAAARSDGAPRAASPPAAAPATGVSAPSEPVGSVAGPASPATDLSPSAAAQAPPSPDLERPSAFVVSAPARHVRPAVDGRRSSQPTTPTARGAEPVAGTSTARVVGSDRDAGSHPRILDRRGPGVRVVRMDATAEAARLEPRIAGVSAGASGHTPVGQPSVARAGMRPEPAVTVEPPGRAIRADGRSPAPTAAPAVRPEPRHAGERSRAVPAAVALLVLLALLAAGIVTKAARRIAGDGPLLRHHADLLRELHAAHRARVHDRGCRRLRAPSTATRS